MCAGTLFPGGLVLLPVALLAEPPLPPLTAGHLGGFVYLGLIGAALTYFFWFRGLAQLGPATVSLLALLSPVTAVGIGWLALDQGLTPLQRVGVLVVLLSVAAGQRLASQPERPATEPGSDRPRALPEGPLCRRCC